MPLRIILIIAFIMMTLTIAHAQSVSIPLNTVKKPAGDLVSNSGQNLDVGEAAALLKKGEDISLLNPQPNKLWQDKKYPTVDHKNLDYPEANEGVQFLSEEVTTLGTFMGRVQSRKNPEIFFRMSVSRYTQSALMRSAFLRKLGYYIPSPKSYRNLRVFFKDEAEKEKFLEGAQMPPVLNDFESRKWILENNKNNHSVVLADSVLEPANSEYFDLQWGFAPNPANPNQLPFVQMLSRNRAYRALIVPYSLVDVPESINRYSTKFASILSGHVILTHPSAESFSSVTYEDIRWLVRQMVDWTKDDYMEIVQAADYPKDIEPLVFAKLMYRVKNLFQTFKMKTAQPIQLPVLNITTKSGVVKNGKVMKEFVPGYPQRFSHGDRESPIKDGDMFRYLSIQGKTSLLSSLLGEFNKRIQVLTTEQAVEKRTDVIKNRIINHIKTKPMEPLYQKVEAWGGPLGGISAYASRHVSSGTYNESSAAIQLVDNLSVSGSLGYFFAIDGLPVVRPGGGANVNVMRDYTHVRPLMSMEEGTKMSWKDLAIPSFMKNLSAVLKSTEPVKGKNPEDPKKLPLDAFLSELRDGEVFTITDSIALSAYAQISASFDVMMGIKPLSYVNSLALGVDASKIILRQTTISRTKEGIQVYVRDQSGKIFGVTFDVNLFINMLKIRAQVQMTDLHTDAFVIDYNPEYADLVDSNGEQRFVKDFVHTRDNLRPALLALFANNETEFLYKRFDHKRFDLEHKFKTKETKVKFLWYRANSFEEDHTVKIQYPRDPSAPDLKPADEEVVLFSNKTGDLEGRDYLGLGLDVAEGLLNHFTPQFKFDLNAPNNPNPANMPFGKAYWRMVNSEADLSPKGEKLSDISIVQHVWGGWGIKQKEFFQIIDSITGKFKDFGIASTPLIDKSEFSNMKSIDFYRVTANLSVLPGGIAKIKKFILQPQLDGKPSTTRNLSVSDSIARFFSWDFAKRGRPNDPAMFKDYLTILGGGDYKKGYAAYKKKCQARLDRSGEPVQASYTGVWRKGNFYFCVDEFVENLIRLANGYPKKDKKGQVRWMTDLLSVVDKYMPLPLFLKFLGEENYVFLVRINGFRTGDEDGDLEYFSNTLGDPHQNIDYANGLFNYYATKTRISPIELDRSQGSFR